MRNKKGVIPKKNYVVLLTIIVVVILLCAFTVTIVLNVRNNRTKVSYLSRTIGEVQYDELDSAFLEMGSRSFLYISYTGSKEVYEFEKKIKEIIIDTNIQDEMLYYNATDLIKDNNLDLLNEKLNLGDNKKIEYLPAIILYKDNKAIDMIQSTSDKILINDGDFTQLLEKYEIIK